MNHDTIRQQVRERYGALAAGVRNGAPSSSCCSGSSCGHPDPISSDLYEADQAGQVPDAALAASLGCGNPTALVDLHPGETVLDLGSGGGIDVLLSARRVGPTGKAYGLDMTDEMLALARENQRKANATNVEFLKGEIEHIPLPEASVDVVISNCVINLSADKDRVLREAFRVLKPGGRFAVADIVTHGKMPAAIRDNPELWSACVAGALEDRDYEARLAAAGFTDVSLEPIRAHDAAALCCGDIGDSAVLSAFVRARKPGPRPGVS